MTNANPTSQPDPAARIVLDLLDGFRASKAAFAAVSLGIFDHLHEGPLTLSQLTEKLDADGPALERLLGACVALQLLSLADGVYRNEPAAERYLRVPKLGDPQRLCALLRSRPVSDVGATGRCGQGRKKSLGASLRRQSESIRPLLRDGGRKAHLPRRHARRGLAEFTGRRRRFRLEPFSANGRRRRRHRAPRHGSLSPVSRPTRRDLRPSFGQGCRRGICPRRRTPRSHRRA